MTLHERLITNEFDATYTIHGRPQPLSRPRFSNGKVYDSQKNQKIEDGWILKAQHKGEPFTGPLHVDLTYCFKVTKARTKKLQKQVNDYKIGSVDLDNLIKKLDYANGIIFVDDKQIVSVHARKIYADEEQTIIKVLKL